MKPLAITRIAATLLAVATLGLPLAASAQCVPNPIPANWLHTQEAPNVIAAPPPHGGHTIALHVGQTDLQLVNRLLAHPHIPAAGSYPAAAPPAPNYATAQATIAAGIAPNAAAINLWAAGAAPGARQAYNYVAAGVIGRVATRNLPNPPVVNNTMNYRVVFQALGGGNCFLLTSFPTP